MRGGTGGAQWLSDSLLVVVHHLSENSTAYVYVYNFFCFRASAIVAIDSPMLCETLLSSAVRDLDVQGRDAG